MKKIIKKVFLVLFLVIIAVYTITQIIYYTRKPIYIVSDSLYYDTTIKYQKTALKYNALLKNNKIIYVVDKESNGEWMTYDYKEGSNIILSPYISLLYSLDTNISFSNPVITIGKSSEGELYNAKGDYVNGFEILAKELKSKSKNVYLISSDDWPQSTIKASAFQRAFGSEGLTYISLRGNELEQKAYEIIEGINTQGNVEVVSAGASLISYFSGIENSISYSLEAYQALSVSSSSLHYIIYEDLLPLLEDNSKDIVLQTKIKNNQEGVINFFLHLLRSLQSLSF